MKIRVTTLSNIIFEGTFLGLNNDNFICVLTENNLTADIMDNISEILLIEE